MRARALFAVLLLVLLAGCASVPDSGRPVRLGAAPLGDTDDDLNDVRQLPGKPQPGASPDRIVQGFLAASKSPDGGHQIARDFLAESAQGWQDNAGTRIVSVDTPTIVGTGRVRVTGRVVARLGADGSYVATDSPLDLLFTLTQVGQAPDAEWRITNPPPGVLLLSSDFTSTYRAFDVFFLSADGENVVPDHRYVDVQRAGLATELVRLLLRGPSSWLAPAVSTAFPRGTGLRSSVVQATTTSSLSVDLAVPTDVGDRPGALQMAAQLVWTLKRFDVGVRVTVDGRPLQVPDHGQTLSPTSFASFDPDAQAADGTARFLADGRVRKIDGPNDSSLTAAPVSGLLSAALSADGSQLAVVRADGRRQQLLVGPARGTLVPALVADSISRPSWNDAADALLVVVDHRSLREVSADGSTAAVSDGGLASRGTIGQAQMSGDGTRLALVADGVLLVGVLSDVRSGLQVSDLRSVRAGLTDVRDVTWADSSHLLVAGRLGAGSPTAVLLTDDGASVGALARTGLPAGEPVTAVAAAAGRADVVICRGQVWRRSGTRWDSPLGDDVGSLTGTSPFYPG